MMKPRRNDYLTEILLVLFLLLYFIILALFFTRPLLSHIYTHKVGHSGDSYYFMWIIGWFKQALFDLGQSPHHSHLLNHPYGFQLAQTEISPLQAILALPFVLNSDSPVFGYNMVMLSTFILSGITMFYWVRELTGSFQASVVASTAYALLPYRIAHMLAGHLNLAAIQWFPLFFWGFLATLQDNQFSWKNVVLLAAGLTGIALTSQYYLFMTFFVCLIVVLIELIKTQFRLGWNCLKQWFIAGTISLPSLIIGIWPYYVVHSGGGTERPFMDVMIYSASITDYFIPFSKSAFFGDLVNLYFQRNFWTESTLYLGIVVLILAGYALIAERKKQPGSIVQRLAMISLTAFVLSLGTNLTWMEQPLWISTPQWLQGVIQKESFLVFLPGYFLYEFVPFFNLMRVWMRYGVILMVMLCVLAGYGTHILVQKIKPASRNIIAFFIVALIVIDFSTTPLALEEVKPRKVDYWLANQVPGGQVQLPLVHSFEQRPIYYTLVNQKPLLGQMKTYPSNRYFLLEPVLRRFPDFESISILRTEKVRYVLLDTDTIQIDPILDSDYQSLDIQFAGVFDEIAVFIIPDS
jgi:hypothetical protein